MLSFSSSIMHTMTFRGLVTLKKSLNYEERSSYNLVVEAQDAGDNVLSSTASIFVQASSYSHLKVQRIENFENGIDHPDLRWRMSKIRSRCS